MRSPWWRGWPPLALEWLVQGIGSTVVYGRDRERRKSRHFTQEQQAERYLARHGFRPD